MKTDHEVMQMALDALEVSTDWDMNATGKQAQSIQAINALRKALAQPDVPETAFGETEPVAWMHNFIGDVITKNRPTDITRNAGRWTALYTAPLQRKPLTDAQIEAISEASVTNCYFDTVTFTRAIESAHGIGRGHA